MHRSHRILAVLAAVIALAVDPAVEFTHRWRERLSRATHALSRACDWLVSAVLRPLREALKQSWLALRNLWPVQRASARQYVLRQAERPRIFPGWRMCPST